MAQLLNHAGQLSLKSPVLSAQTKNEPRLLHLYYTVGIVWAAYMHLAWEWTGFYQYSINAIVNAINSLLSNVVFTGFRCQHISLFVVYTTVLDITA